MKFSTSPRVRPTAPHGFTLIEMLVVIAIIALLVSITVPVVSRALESARNTQCVSNLRQIGIAIQGYAADHRGVLPPAGFYGVSPHYNRDPRNFPNSLRDYLGLPEATTWSTSPDETSYAAVFACPSFEGPVNGKCYRLSQTVTDSSGNTVRPWGFMTSANGSMSPPPERQQNIPGEEIALRDTDHQEQVSHKRHRNALFFDLHVGRLNLQNERL